MHNKLGTIVNNIYIYMYSNTLTQLREIYHNKRDKEKKRTTSESFRGRVI